MDTFLILVVTIFIVLVGALFWYTSSSSRSSQQLPSLNVSPEVMVEMQLEEILESKDAAAPGGHSFRVTLTEKEAYEATKAAESDENAKSLQAALLKRCIACLQATMSFDARVKVVYESYANLVPREVLGYLGTVKTQLTDEIEAIKTEASRLKADWGTTIFQQAMDLTYGLQKRKEARANAEEQKKEEEKKKEQAKKDEARQAELAKAQQAKAAERAYQELMRTESGGKGASQKKSATTSQKK